jgi:hypothetical protein
VAGLSSQRPGFLPWSVHVGSADKAALRFSPVSIIPPAVQAESQPTDAKNAKTTRGKQPRSEAWNLKSAGS